jgi:pimeloyl-ACP methyl ester carboxylesterase
VTPSERRVDLPGRGLALRLREWPGSGRPFLLVHGLASNAHTWDRVAPRLNERGHYVAAVDQRGHGLSDKPEAGYGFDEVTSDLHALIGALGLDRPVIAGQSWGGNVVLDYAARRPSIASGIVLVDGGFIELSAAPGATWEKTAVEMRPPPLAGMARQELLDRMRSFMSWASEEALAMQMANFETLADGTIRPWLTLDRHMLILRAIWEQKPSEIYAQVTTPTLIAVADSPDAARAARKEAEVAMAEARIPRVAVKRFEGSHHDIHVHQPAELAEWMLAALEAGFFDDSD